jgi:endoglucanase
MSNLSQLTHRHGFKLLSLVLVLAVVPLMVYGSVPAPAQAAAGFLHTNGRYIVNEAGTVVHFSGVNWYGFEDSALVPHGLDVRGYKSLLDQVKTMGFNSIRLPYSDSIFPSAVPQSWRVNSSLNPDLVGLSSLAIMDKIVNYGGSIGLKFIIDRHRPDMNSQAELPVTAACPETTCWIQHLKDLALRYNGNTAVVAFDLHNEPHGAACWGCATTANDWRGYAQRAGNAVLSVNPNVLIIVEGIEKAADGETSWWGGNLKDYGANLLTLNVANRVVYSAHDYPFSIWTTPGQKWFLDPSAGGTWVSDGSNLPAVWDRMWGYLFKTKSVPVLIGEFGTKLVDSKDIVWLGKLRDYIQANAVDWTFWDLNPDSGDTGGILQADWNTVESGKMTYLNPIKYALIDTGGAAPTNTPTKTNTPGATATPTKTNTPGPSATPTKTNTPTATTSGGGGGTLKLQYKAGDTITGDNVFKPHFKIANLGTTAVPLSELKIRYYFTKNVAGSLVFNCDYAAAGCANLSSTFAAYSPVTTTADYYMEISFTTGAGSVAANGTSDIQTRINEVNWSNFNEANDYSFDATKIAFADWTKIVLLRNGTVVWGTAP